MADGGVVACNGIRGYLVRCSWCSARPSRSSRPTASAWARLPALWASSRRCRRSPSSTPSLSTSWGRERERERREREREREGRGKEREGREREREREGLLNLV